MTTEERELERAKGALLAARQAAQLAERVACYGRRDLAALAQARLRAAEGARARALLAVEKARAESLRREAEFNRAMAARKEQVRAQVRAMSR
jgi:hypothetical protein